MSTPREDRFDSEPTQDAPGTDSAADITDLPPADAGDEADSVKGGHQVENRKHTSLSNISRTRWDTGKSSIDNAK